MYAKVEDFNKFEEEFSEVIPALTGNGFDKDIVTGLIMAATEEIDNYLMSQYSLPLDPTPLTVKRLCIDITRYYLFSDHSDIIPEQVESNYKIAMYKLKDYSSGKAQLAGFESNKPLEKLDAESVPYKSQFDNLGYFND